MRQLKKEYNITIELFRIFFTSVILLHHFRMYSDELPFGGGYMATDMFFMMSGYLLEITYKKEKTFKIWRYTLKRYLRFVLPLLVCNFALLVTSFVVIGYRLPKGIGGYIRENLMIEIFTLNAKERFNPPTWYLGILFLVTVVVITILTITENRNNKGIIRNVIFSLLIVCYFAILFFNNDGNIYVEKNSVFPFYAFLRGTCGVVIGACIGNSNRKVPDRLALMGIVILLSIYTYLLLWKDGYSRFDIIVYVAIVGGMWLSANWQPILNRYISEMIVIVARSSYVAFLIHYPIVRIMNVYRIWDGLDWKIYSLAYLLCIWAIAVALNIIMKLVMRFVTKRNAHMKR